MSKLEVLYNSECPVCSREIAHYQKRTGDDIVYDPISETTPADWGITKDQAARELHVRVDGETLSGVGAFLALWARVPGFRWLARLVSVWPLRPLAGLIYSYIAAPLLYRMHLRRQR